MKTSKQITLNLNKYDFKEGVSKNFTDADLCLNDFKPELQKKIEKADIVNFNGLGVGDVPLGGRQLKDRNGTSPYSQARKQMEWHDKIRKAEEKADARRNNIFWLFVIGVTLFSYIIRSH